MFDSRDELIRSGLKQARYGLKTIRVFLYFHDGTLSSKRLNPPNTRCNSPFAHKHENTDLSG